MLRKSLVLIGSAFLLGGCAIPVPLQIASWALDGISMLTTQKSVTDHGISMMAQRDCAVWRGVTEGELCREVEATDALVAEDTVKSPTSAGLKPTTGFNTQALNETHASALVDSRGVVAPVLSIRQPLQVRAVPTHALRAAWAEKTHRETVEPTAAVSAQGHALRAVKSQPQAIKPEPEVVVSKAPSVQVTSLSSNQSVPAKTITRVANKEPEKGIYYVIGSFRDPANAERLVAKNSVLSPAVLNARLDGTNVYRVVVGPVPRGKEKRLHRALARDGFPDTWAIRVDPDNWRFAQLKRPHSKTALQLATLQK